MLALALLPMAAASAPCPERTRVGVTALGYQAFETMDGVHGIMPDVAAELARRTACPVALVLLPHSRLLPELHSRHIDMILALTRTAARDADGQFIPLAPVRFALLLPAGAAAFGSLRDFVRNSQMRLDLVRGLSYPSELAGDLALLARSGRLGMQRDYAAVFRHIAAGRASATLATQTIAAFYPHAGLHASAVAEAPWQTIGAYVSRTTLDEQQRARYAQAIAAIVADGTLRAIHLRYLGDAALRSRWPP